MGQWTLEIVRVNVPLLSLQTFTAPESILFSVISYFKVSKSNDGALLR